MSEEQNPSPLDEEKEPFEVRRWRTRTVRVFAAMDTMDQIAERVLGIVGENRVINKTWTYVHRGGLEDLSHLTHATGLHKGGHAGHPEGHHTWRQEDQAGFSVYLTHEFGTMGTMEGFGVGILAWNATTEKDVRQRYEKGRNASDGTSVFDERRDITYLEIHGTPGEPHREDRIEIMEWNTHGVLTHTIITFTEPDHCDSGRISETEYVIVGHRKDPGRGRFAFRNETPEVFARFTTDDQAVEEELARIKDRDDIEYAWLAEEKITRERRSVR